MRPFFRDDLPPPGEPHLTPRTTAPLDEPVAPVTSSRRRSAIRSRDDDVPLPWLSVALYLFGGMSILFGAYLWAEALYILVKVDFMQREPRSLAEGFAGLSTIWTIPGGWSCIVFGLLLSAAAKVVSLLTDIRHAVRAEGRKA